MWWLQWVLRSGSVVAASPQFCLCAAPVGQQGRAVVAGVHTFHSRIPPAAPHTTPAFTSNSPHWQKSVRRRAEWNRQDSHLKQYSTVALQRPSLIAENNVAGRIVKCSQRLMSSRSDTSASVNILGKDRKETEWRDPSGRRNHDVTTPGVNYNSSDSDSMLRGSREVILDGKNNVAGGCGAADIEEEGDQVDFEALVEMEVELSRQEGRSVPSSFTSIEWQELLTKKSVSSRRKYLLFLFKKEMIKLSEKKKKQERKQQYDELRFLELKEAKESGHIVYGLWNNSMFLRIPDQKMTQYYHSRVVQAMMFGQPLVFDLGFDNYMNSIERQNCAYQLQLLISDNRTHRDPYHLHLCNAPFSSDTFTRLHRFIPPLLKPEYPLNVSSESYLECYPHHQLVYLTPHCREMMTQYDHDAVYIIGGLVDKGSGEPLTLAKAKRERIRMQKLPLDKYLDWGAGGTKSLTLNQTLLIMLDMKLTGDWNYALRHVPRRKLRMPLTLEQREEKMRYMLKRDRGGRATMYRSRK